MSSRLRVYYNKNVKIHSAVGHLECLEGRREKKKTCCSCNDELSVIIMAMVDSYKCDLFQYIYILHQKHATLTYF